MKNLYIKNVVTLSLDEGKCICCGMCVNVCPREVFKLDQKLEIVAKDRCIECGACVMNCPNNALFVDKGVGCANLLVNQLLGRKSKCCC